MTNARIHSVNSFIDHLSMYISYLLFYPSRKKKMKRKRAEGRSQEDEADNESADVEDLPVAGASHVDSTETERQDILWMTNARIHSFSSLADVKFMCTVSPQQETQSFQQETIRQAPVGAEAQARQESGDRPANDGVKEEVSF
jgi:hypothetical protein